MSISEETIEMVEEIAFPPDVSIFTEYDLRPTVASTATILSQDNLDAGHDWLRVRLNKIEREYDNEIAEAKKKYLIPNDEEDEEIDDTVYNTVVQQIESNVQERTEAAYSEYQKKLLVSDAELISSNEYKELVIENNAKLQGVIDVEAKKMIQSEFIRRVKDLREEVVSKKVGQGVDLENYLASEYGTIITDVISDVSNESNRENSSQVIRYSNFVRTSKGAKLVQRTGEVRIAFQLPTGPSAISHMDKPKEVSSEVSSNLNSNESDKMRFGNVDSSKGLNEAELASRINEILTAEEKASLATDISSASEVDSVSSPPTNTHKTVKDSGISRG